MKTQVSDYALREIKVSNGTLWIFTGEIDVIVEG